MRSVRGDFWGMSKRLRQRGGVLIFRVKLSGSIHVVAVLKVEPEEPVTIIPFGDSDERLAEV